MLYYPGWLLCNKNADMYEIAAVLYELPEANQRPWAVLSRIGEGFS